MKKLFLFPLLLFPLVGCSSGESSSTDYISASPIFITDEGKGMIEVRKQQKEDEITLTYSMKIGDQIFDDFIQYWDITIDDKLKITDFTCNDPNMEFNIYYAVTNKAGDLEVHVDKNIKLNNMNTHLENYINPYFKYGKKFYLCIGTADLHNWTHGLDEKMDKALEEKESVPTK